MTVNVIYQVRLFLILSIFENTYIKLYYHASSKFLSITNWYFESIDKQLGASTINSYLQQIGYGNENISGDFSSYWMQSSLKISPVEQVELLKNLYRNNFNFTPANIHAVKNSIHLTASENGEFMEKPEPDE